MIYNFVVDRLEQVDGMKDRIFPVGVNIDDIYTADNDFFFSVYNFQRRTPEYDLEGDLHHYTEEIVVDFIGRLYDKLHEAYAAVENAFCVGDISTDTGEYIFSVRCSSPQPDAFDPEYGLLRRTMLVTIQWCPV